jgi:1-acyl-sn-glycerol-3-phosphate acyltransferase
MKITAAPNFTRPAVLNQAPKAPETPPGEAPQPETPTPKPPSKPEKEIPNYTGPADGLSHYDPEAAKWIRPLNKGLVHLWRNTDVRGQENIPATGAHMLAFNHGSYSDASIVASLTDRDIRTMAAKEQFTGAIGKMMTAMGAFPVDRGATSTKPIETMIDLINDGKSVAIAPEGRIHDDNENIHEFKGGAAMVALKSQCESIIPVVIHYEEHKATTSDRVKTYLTAGAVVAGGLACALVGGPALRAVSGVLTGALTGAAVGGGIGFATTKDSDLRAKAGGALEGAKWGALAGAATGGLGGGLLGSNAIYVAGPLSAGAGLVSLAAAKAYHERTEAHVEVGTGVSVAPYRELSGKEGREKLTADLHKNMSGIKDGIKSRIRPQAPADDPETK